MRRKVLVLLATIIAVFSTASLALTASATPHPTPTPHIGAHKLITYYYWPESGVNGGNLGYVVDDTGNGGNGTQQQIWTPNGNSQQGWYLTCFQSDCAYYWLVNENGKCLDDKNGGTSNGNPVQIYTCIQGDHNQAWFYNKYQGSNGAYAMWINYNGVCMTDQHPYTDGGKIVMWQCEFPPNNHNSQAWQVPAATW